MPHTRATGESTKAREQRAVQRACKKVIKKEPVHSVPKKTGLAACTKTGVEGLKEILAGYNAAHALIEGHLDRIVQLGRGDDMSAQEHEDKLYSIIEDIWSASDDWDTHAHEKHKLEERLSTRIMEMWQQLSYWVVDYGEKAAMDVSADITVLRSACIASRDYTDLANLTDQMSDYGRRTYAKCMRMQKLARHYDDKIHAMLGEVLGTELCTLNASDHFTLDFLVSRHVSCGPLMLAWCEAWPRARRDAMKIMIKTNIATSLQAYVATQTIAAPVPQAAAPAAVSSDTSVQFTASSDSPPFITAHVLNQVNNLIKDITELGFAEDEDAEIHWDTLHSIISKIWDIVKNYPAYVDAVELLLVNAIRGTWHELNHGIVVFGKQSAWGASDKDMAVRLRSQCMDSRDFAALADHPATSGTVATSGSGDYQTCMNLQKIVRNYNDAILAMLQGALKNTKHEYVLARADHKTLEFLNSRIAPENGLMLAWCEAWPSERRAAMKDKIVAKIRELF